MKTQITYAITKRYKGLFRKKHAGNTHMFFIPVENERRVMVFYFLGWDTESGAAMFNRVLTRPIEYAPVLIREFGNKMGENFIVVEELPCKTRSIHPEGNYQITIPKPGKYIQSSFILELESEHSKGGTMIYSSKDFKGNIEMGNIKPETVAMVSKKMASFIPKGLK